MKTRYTAYTADGKAREGHQGYFFLAGETRPLGDGLCGLSGETEQSEPVFSLVGDVKEEAVPEIVLETLRQWDDLNRQPQPADGGKVGAGFASLSLSGHAVRVVREGAGRVYRIRQGEMVQISPNGAGAAAQGDVYLLCSPGLSGAVSEEQILHTVSGDGDLSGSCKALVDLALAQGGQGGVAAVLIGVTEADTSEAPAATAEKEVAAASGPQQTDAAREWTPGPAAAEEPARKRRKRGCLAPVFAVLLLIVLAVGGTGFYRWSHPTVPDVVGMGQERAIAALEALGFQVETKEYYHDSAEAGAVFAQSVLAGDRGSRSTAVTISVSLGEEPVPVDDVVGLDVEEAQEILNNRGLVVEITESYSETALIGEVLSQSIQSGDAAFPGDTIQLDVSKGAEEDAVPDVVGEDQETARQTLEAAGYQVSIRWAYEDETEGSVVYQEPAAGSKLEAGESVLLILSMGESRIDVPDLTGMSRIEAANTLVSLGLTYTFDYQSSSTVESDHVISQSPAAGKSLLQGENVFFYLAE